MQANSSKTPGGERLGRERSESCGRNWLDRWVEERYTDDEKNAILEANRPLAHREFARLRPCAREQWLRRAFHPDAQREPVVGAALRDDRATAPGAAGAPGTCNATWLIERHGFITPTAFREEQLHSFAKAA